MPLEEYNKKREFDKTSEPEGLEDKTNAGRFVIQRHDASKLHYDLRLEMEGVLKSWAVPKGPSLNPDDKRLAVQTEDHPVKYLTFKGRIPKGNYGAGKMTIWDSGTYSINKTISDETDIDQLNKGNLKIAFHGSKIKGDFALVKAHFGDKKNNWLLIKKADQYAVNTPYDSETFVDKSTLVTKKSKSIGKLKDLKDNTDLIKPMLAKTGTKIFDDKDWIFELKWDGYRTMASLNHGEVKLYSRNGLSLNTKFSPLLKGLKLFNYEAIIDGEVVLLNNDGTANFQELQNFEGDSNKNLIYYAFDLVYLNGHATVSLPLKDRKELLKEIIDSAEIESLRYCDHIQTLGKAFYEKALKSGLEGVIAKKKSSTYKPGLRSDAWLKFKEVNTLEAIICGFTESESQEFGSLILGVYKDNTLRYIGNCGTGFNATKRKELLDTLNRIKTKKSPFKTNPKLKGRKPHWVEPIIICEVGFSEITDNGLLRHPVFKNLREDKMPSEVNLPNSQNFTNIESDGRSSLEIDGNKVAITHPAKIYFPEKGIRKYDLIDYYIQVADTILPYLRDRPQNLHRHPNGITKKGFYQKDNENLPTWVDTVKIHSKSANKDMDYLLCQNESTLIYMANLGCIELNPWNSTIDNLDNPTYTVIDIDPTDKTPFKEVIEVALVTKEILDTAGVKGYCKTSGSSGLHIYIPLGGAYSYDEARGFVKLICHFVQERLPKTTSMERSIKAREGKIYLDFMQNKRGQTLAAPYCVRPKPGATVSTPLEWNEVNNKLKISDFNIFNLPTRLLKVGDLFAQVLTDSIDMEAAIVKLDKL